MSGFVTALVKYRDSRRSDWVICTHAGELCCDRQLLHLVTKRALSNDHVVVPNFNAFINCLVLGSLKQVLVLRVKTRDVFFKRQYRAKGPLAVSNIVCDSWASSFSRRFVVNPSFTLHKNFTDESVQMVKCPSLILLGSGVLFYRGKAWFRKKKTVLECLPLSEV